MTLYDLIWLLPAFPLAGAAFNGLVSNRLGLAKGVTHAVALAASGLAWLWGWGAVVQWLADHGPHHTHVVRLFTWVDGGELSLPGGGSAPLLVDASFQLDPLSAVMVAFVTVVGFLVHLHSVGAMRHEPDRSYARYFAYLNLLMFSMLVLVLGSNLPVLFVGWEVVGLCSSLLIGYFHDREWCASAGMKAFVVNRVGDLGFLLAIPAAFAVFGSFEYSAMFAAAAGDPERYAGAATVIAVLLLAGAAGKSAQVPLHVWLPDATAGPTPVLALIHAASVVTAGVYLVARCNVLFRLSPTAMLVVALVGATTAILAATVALAQNDVKKVLAYSTVSQLGYMFLAAGAGAFVAAVFHLVTHAFFTACLFLGCGSVIRACSGEQDLRQMGGLKRYLPTTYWTFLVATIAVAGIFPFAGFFSRNEILASVFAAGATDLNRFGTVYTVLWALALGGVALTALAMFRLLYLTFHGSFRGGQDAERLLYESPWTMTLPLQVLAVASIVVGFLGVPGRLLGRPTWNLVEGFMQEILLPFAGGDHAAATHLGEHAVSLQAEWNLALVSLAVAGFGIALAYRFYAGPDAGSRPRRLTEAFPFTYKLLLNKYWVDELYAATVVAPTLKLSRFLWDFDARVVDGAVNASRHVTVGSSFLSGIFDLKVVDGLVTVVGDACDAASHRLRRVQVGFTQGYAMVMVLGAAALLAVYFIL